MSAINLYLRLDLQDLRLTHTSTKHPSTERQLQTAVASFEETEKLTATEEILKGYQEERLKCKCLGYLSNSKTKKQPLFTNICHFFFY